MGGGQDKPAWTACPPGVKITRAGGKISRDSLPPGVGQANRGWLAPRGGKLSRGQDKLGHRDTLSTIVRKFEPAHEIMVLITRRPAKAQASLHIHAVSPEPSLFAHMKYGSRQRV